MTRSVPKLVAILAACAVTSVAHGTVWLYPQDGTLDELSDLAADGDTIIMTANADNDRLDFDGMSERNVIVEANGHSIASSAAPLTVTSNDRVIVRNAVLEEQPDFPTTLLVILRFGGSLLMESCTVIGSGAGSVTVKLYEGEFAAVNCSFENMGRMYVSEPSSTGVVDVTLTDCEFVRDDGPGDYIIALTPPTEAHNLTLTDCTFRGPEGMALLALKLASGTNELTGVFIENAGELAVVTNGTTTISSTTICAWAEEINLPLMLVGDWIDGGDVLLTYGDCESPIAASCLADLDKSGSVGFNDLTILLNAWGVCQ